MTPARAIRPDARLFVYQARAVRVVDGDTLDVTIDRGMHDYSVERLRLLGVNAPETNKAATRKAGLAAAEFVREWLAAHARELDGPVPGVDPERWPLIVRTEKSDTFGRYLADVECRAGHGLNAALVERGHAIPFMVAA